MQLCAVAAAGIQLEHVALRAEEACCGRGPGGRGVGAYCGVCMVNANALT